MRARPAPARDGLRGQSSSGAIGSLAAVLLLALALLVVPRWLGPEQPAPPPCPPGTGGDRAARVREVLARTARGRELLAAAPAGLRVCFRQGGEPGLVRPDLVLLEAEAGDGEAAAVLGHLLLHAAEPPFAPEEVDPALPCDRVVGDAVAAEARAHALELDLRRELGVRDSRRRLPFEEAYLAAPPARGVELVRAYLLAHPSGGGGLPGFVELYRRRCEERRARTAPSGS